MPSMPQVNKIEKYELGIRVLELSVGRNTQEVAEAITSEIQGKGINDAISQSSVSRYLRSIREARAEETRRKVQEHIQEHVPADLNAIEEIELWLLDRFRGKVDLSQIPDAVASEVAAIIDGDHKTRAEFAMKAAKLVELKLKYAAILENPEQRPAAGADPADLEEFRQDMEAEKLGKVYPH